MCDGFIGMEHCRFTVQLAELLPPHRRRMWAAPWWMISIHRQRWARISACREADSCSTYLEVNMRFSRVLVALAAIVMTALGAAAPAMAATDTATLAVTLSPTTVVAGS